MREIRAEEDGWQWRSDYDYADVEEDDRNDLGAEVRGCYDSIGYKENEGFLAEISYEERLHNSLVVVKAVVYSRSERTEERKTYTLNDVVYLVHRRFDSANLGEDGLQVKADAARFVSDIKQLIDSRYFNDQESP